MRIGIDILENEIVQQYTGVLDILICDRSTQKNIFWATENYTHLGKTYNYYAPITPNLITGKNGDVIMPRVQKIRFYRKLDQRKWQKFSLLLGFAMPRIT